MLGNDALQMEASGDLYGPNTNEVQLKSAKTPPLKKGELINDEDQEINSRNKINLNYDSKDAQSQMGTENVEVVQLKLISP